MRPFHHVAGGEVPQPPHLPVTRRTLEWHTIRFLTYSCSWNILAQRAPSGAKRGPFMTLSLNRPVLEHG